MSGSRHHVPVRGVAHIRKKPTVGEKSPSVNKMVYIIFMIRFHLCFWPTLMYNLSFQSLDRTAFALDRSSTCRYVTQRSLFKLSYMFYHVLIL